MVVTNLKASGGPLNVNGGSLKEYKIVGRESIGTSLDIAERNKAK